MRTLIIGDPHHRFEAVERAMEQVPHDQAVVVGDHFDDFGDGRSKAKRTAFWLKESLYIPNRIHLLGNHDVPYCRNVFECPGWDPRKDEAVKYVMKDEDWRRMRFYVWIDDWLISHAGVHPCHIPSQISDDLPKIKEWLEGQNEGAWQALFDPINHYHWFWDRSFARSGDNAVGGLLWQDWNYDFSPASFNQIVGHTPDGTTPIRKTEGYLSVNYCVDGLWGGVLVLDDGKPEVWLKTLTSDGSFAKV